MCFFFFFRILLVLPFQLRDQESYAIGVLTLLDHPKTPRTLATSPLTGNALTLDVASPGAFSGCGQDLHLCSTQIPGQVIPPREDQPALALQKPGSSTARCTGQLEPKLKPT